MIINTMLSHLYYLSKIWLESFVLLWHSHRLYCHHTQHNHHQICHHRHSLCILSPACKHCTMSSIIQQILLYLNGWFSRALNCDSIVRLQSDMYEVCVIVCGTRISHTHFVLIVVAMCCSLFESCHGDSILEEILFWEVFGDLDIKNFVFG